MAPPKNKCKFTLWLRPEVRDKIVELYKENDCISKSEFVEKAIRFYIGYLTASDESNYLPNMFLSNMRAIAAESDNRQSRIMFKMAVEMAMMMNLVAAFNDVDPGSLEKLRGECINEVKRLNGSFSLKDAVDWRNGN